MQDSECPLSMHSQPALFSSPPQEPGSSCHRTSTFTKDLRYILLIGGLMVPGVTPARAMAAAELQQIFAKILMLLKLSMEEMNIK